MKALLLDTETTGRFRYDRRADQPGQPRLVEFCGVLLDVEDRKRIETYDTLIQPAGWQISAEAEAVHGITNEMAMAEGIPVTAALVEINRLWLLADFIVAYSVDYDLKMIRAERRRAGLEDWYGLKDKFDCMRPLTPHCRLPATPNMIKAGRGKQLKTPSLTEAARIILDVDHEGAHRAVADVDVTEGLFWFLWDKGQRPVPDAKAEKGANRAEKPAGERETAAATPTAPKADIAASDAQARDDDPFGL